MGGVSIMGYPLGVVENITISVYIGYLSPLPHVQKNKNFSPLPHVQILFFLV